MSTVEMPVPEGILQLFAAKAPGPQTIGELVAAVESVPRYGPTAHAGCIGQALGSLGITCSVVGGAYWGQSLTEAIREQMKCKRYVLALDFDTVFTASNVQTLFDFMEENPHIDAIASLQIGREKMRPLFGAVDGNNNYRQITRWELHQPLVKIHTANFALTMLRSESLKKCQTPWFLSRPAPDGFWGDGRVDADIVFWEKWADSGLNLYQANYVVVGHLETVISWPSRDLRTVYQSLNEYGLNGITSACIHWKPTILIGENEEVRLNLGSGAHDIPGYVAIDRIFGTEAYPLEYPDSSVVEIRASHLLEHFAGIEVPDVLRDWVRVLRPGGLLRIAVPDLDKVLAMRDSDPYWLSYLLGAPGSGFHGSAFNEPMLRAYMSEAGITDIRRWTCEPIDDASFPFSLNLEGTKQ